MLSGIIAAWREVKLIVAALTALSVLSAFTKRRWLSLLPLTLLAWVFYFFRDPERLPAIEGDEWILAPADGVITRIDTLDEAYFFNGPVQRIVIFLSIFNVHVQRAPYAGSVQTIRYQKGGFAPAFLDSAQENESNFIGLTTSRGPLAIKQMTGILARRIVCRVKEGNTLSAGQRVGLIKFGSRVDLFVPLDAEILVKKGQKVRGGQTVVGRWKNPKTAPK